MQVSVQPELQVLEELVRQELQFRRCSAKAGT